MILDSSEEERDKAVDGNSNEGTCRVGGQYQTMMMMRTIGGRFICWVGGEKILETGEIAAQEYGEYSKHVPFWNDS